MENIITWTLITYITFTINLSALKSLLSSGKINTSRSIKSLLIFPPFAIILVCLIAFYEVSKSNLETIKEVMSKKTN